MPLPPDYHLHTPLCKHASGEPPDYARRALALGLTEIGFSDHSPMRQDDFDVFFGDRRERLIAMIEAAMGTPVLREVVGAQVEVFDPEPTEEDDESDLSPASAVAEDLQGSGE